jgi:hypothetical protein
MQAQTAAGGPGVPCHFTGGGACPGTDWDQRPRARPLRAAVVEPGAGHLGETGQLSHAGGSSGGKAPGIRHINGVEVRKKRPRAFTEPPISFSLPATMPAALSWRPSAQPKENDVLYLRPPLRP